MNRKERLTGEAQFTTAAKAISVIFMVGIVVLLAAPAPHHSGEIAGPATPPVIAHAVSDVGTRGSPPPSAAAAAGSATRDSAPNYALRSK